jgi:hypothetical protein
VREARGRTRGAAGYMQLRDNSVTTRCCKASYALVLAASATCHLQHALQCTTLRAVGAAGSGCMPWHYSGTRDSSRHGVCCGTGATHVAVGADCEARR